MRARRFGSILAFGFLMASSACNFSMSSANLSSLKIGSDKDISNEVSTFKPTDAIYANAVASNVPGKIKVTGRLVVEDVPGEKPGPIPSLETSVNLDGSGTASFHFTPPPSGWPAGKYKLEVLMFDDQGQQKDQKSASFTVS